MSEQALGGIPLGLGIVLEDEPMFHVESWFLRYVHLCKGGGGPDPLGVGK